MKHQWTAIVVVLVGLSAACSKPPDAAGAPASGTANSKPPDAARAPESAKPAAAIGGSTQPGMASAPASGKGAPEIASLACPPKAEFPARAAGAPVDDILGIRQGANLSDAMLFLKCRAGSHVVFTEESAGIITDTHGQKFRQVVTATDGVPRARPYNFAKAVMSDETGTPDFDLVTEEVMFWSLGVQGSEIVWGVARFQTFKSGEQPAVTTVMDQLSAKYGQPNFIDEQNSGVSWVFDPLGRMMSKATAAASKCRGSGISIGGGQVFSDCGLTITAHIEKSNNPLLADKVSVGIVDQGKYMAATTDFERTLVSAQKEQQSSEAAKAAKGKAPVF